MFKLLDLFSGIGGFSLGLERTGGFETVAFCEIEPFPRAVLKEHWPDVPCYEDVRSLTAERLGSDGISVDVICGGFPCQDLSYAGKGAGLEGARSGLWSEIARLVGELRPKYLIVENVSALLSRGLGRVLGDLAEIGYDAEWHCIPASAVGAPHRRDRIWIVAYPIGRGYGLDDGSGQNPGEAGAHQGEGHQRERLWAVAGGSGAALADAAFMFRDGGELYGKHSQSQVSKLGDSGGETNVADAKCGRLQSWNEQCSQQTTIIPAAFGRYCRGSQFGETWWVEPDVGRVAYGIPATMDRLKGLGNAVVPQIPEMIGRAILASE